MHIRAEMLLHSISLLIILAFAQHLPIWEPPTTPDSPVNRPTVKHEILNRIQVSGLKIALENTQLSKVQKRLGGTIGHRGDASESLSWLCMHGNDQSGEWILWLMSGEIDGGTVGGFRWGRVTRGASVDGRCQTLRGEKVIDLPIKLELGIKEAEIVRLLGQPTQKLGDRLVYVHEHEEMRHNERYTATNALTLYLHEGVVWAIETWKSTTS